MVDKPNPIQPQGPKPLDPAKKTEGTAKSDFGFKGEHTFVGLKFSEAEWGKLMNTCLRSLSEYINKTFQKMTEQMKKDWKRGRGEDPD